MDEHCRHFHSLLEASGIADHALNQLVRSKNQTLAWDDARAGIAWPLEGTPKLSPKDREGTSWEDTLQAMREASQV